MPLLSDLAQNPLARPRRPQTYEELERVRHTLPEAEVEAIAREIEERAKTGRVLDMIEGRTPRPGLEGVAGIGALQGLLENRPSPAPSMPELPPVSSSSARESLDRMDWAKTHQGPETVLSPPTGGELPGNVAFATVPYEGRPKDRFNPKSDRQSALVSAQLQEKLDKFAKLMAKERDERVEKERELQRTQALRGMAESLGGFRPSLAADYLLTGGPPAPTNFVAEDLRVKEAEEADALRGLGLAQSLRQAGFRIPDGMTESQLAGIFPHLSRHQLAEEQLAAELMAAQAEALAGEPPSNRQTEELTNIEGAIRSMEKIIEKRKQFEPGKFSNFFAGAANLSGFGDLFGLGPRNAFESELTDNLFKALKAQSGAQYSAKEYEQFKKVFPTLWDDDETFDIKAKGILDRLYTRRDEVLRGLTAQGKDTAPFGGSGNTREVRIFDGPTAQTAHIPVEVYEEKLAELKAEGYEVEELE